MSFAENLKYLMKEFKISNYRLAKDIECHPSSVTNWLEAEMIPHKKTREKIADYFNISLYELDREELPPIRRNTLIDKEKSPHQKEGGNESDLLNEIVAAVRKADHDTQMDIYEMIKIIMKREK